MTVFPESRAVRGFERTGTAKTTEKQEEIS